VTAELHETSAVELEWALPAREAKLRDDGTIDIIGGAVDTLVLAAGVLPTELELTVAARVRAPMSEWREHGHGIRVDVLAPGRETVGRLREPLHEIEAPPRLHPDVQPGRLLALSVSWSAAVLGDYRLTRPFQ
jgi:hypothetical protein